MPSSREGWQARAYSWRSSPPRGFAKSRLTCFANHDRYVRANLTSLLSFLCVSFLQHGNKWVGFGRKVIFLIHTWDLWQKFSKWKRKMAAGQNQDSNVYNIWRSLLRKMADETRMDGYWYEYAPPRNIQVMCWLYRGKWHLQFVWAMEPFSKSVVKTWQGKIFGKAWQADFYFPQDGMKLL